MLRPLDLSSVEINFFLLNGYGNFLIDSCELFLCKSDGVFIDETKFIGSVVFLKG